MILSIRNNSKVVYELARAHAVHTLDDQRVILALFGLHPMHQLLRLWTSNTETVLLILHHLPVPSASDRVVVLRENEKVTIKNLPSQYMLTYMVYLTYRLCFRRSE